MSTVTSTITSCPTFQSMLVDYFNVCNQSGRPESPLFQFLYSGINRSNLRGVINPTPGRKRDVRLVFDQPVLGTSATTPSSWALNCTASTERGDLYADYSIDYTDARELEEKISLADWIESCRSDGELIMGKVMRLIDGVMTALYQKVAEDMPPTLGGWASTVAVDADDFLNVATEKPSSDDINVKAFQKIQTAKMKTGYCAPTFGVGGSDLYEYYQIMKAGCCSSQGLDALAILNQLGEAFAYDHWVEQEMGADTSLLLQVGSVQLLSYNAVVPTIALNGIADLDLTFRNGFTAIIQDPRTGYPLDLSMKMDCQDISIVVRGLAKPVGLPFNLQAEGSVFEGVNWAAGIQVVNS